jgi:hypothetical protein
MFLFILDFALQASCGTKWDAGFATSQKSHLVGQRMHPNTMVHRFSR